ncbi:type IV secretory system conjugative DNA transfer family protein [Enterococcus termitis]|nr:type IV secretory system conjugative DNA transfer family protein [Enterococcus termitis]
MSKLKFRSMIRPFKESKLGKQTWRNADKTPYKNAERFLGLRRILIPLSILLMAITPFFVNYVFSFFDLLTDVFSEGLFSGANWERLWQPVYFIRFPFSSGFTTVFYVLLILVLYFFEVKHMYKLRKGFMPLEEHMTEATSRWSYPKELDSQYETMATDNLDDYDGPAGIPIGTAPRSLEDLEKGRVREYIADESTNTAIVGETRAGKGVFGVEKIIDGLSRTKKVLDKVSMVIHDPSGELYLKWKKLLEKRGYVVKLLNLIDTYVSDSTNPLMLVAHYYKQYLFGETEVERNKGLDQAQAELATLCYSYFNDDNAKEKIWQNSSIALFSAGTQALMEEALLLDRPELINVYTILNMIAEMNGDRIAHVDHPILVAAEPDKQKRTVLFTEFKGKAVLDFYFTQLPEGHPARISYQDIKASAPAAATIGNVVTNMLSDMKAFRRTGNAKLMAQTSFDYMDLGFGKKPMAVFIVVSDQDKSNHAIAANFIDQSFKELNKKGLRQPNRKLKRRVCYLDEEFGNMVKVPEQGAKTTDGLKVGISHVFVMQNYEQVDKYGEGEAATILSNCGNIIVVKTKSKKTRETIIDDLGNRANLSLSRQGKPGETDRTLTDSVERIPMVTKDELARIPFGRTIVIRSMKTHDLKGKVIENIYPIYNRDDTKMEEAWKYLPYEECSWDDIEELYDDAPHTRIRMDDLLYKVDVSEIPLKEARRKAIMEESELDEIESEEFIDTTLEETGPSKVLEIRKQEPAKQENMPLKEDSPKGSSILMYQNEVLSELELIFDDYIRSDIQKQKIWEGFPYPFVKKISRCVRVYYEDKPRYISEYESLLEGNSTIIDLKNWLSNVGREELFQQVIDLIETGGMR